MFYLPNLCPDFSVLSLPQRIFQLRDNEGAVSVTRASQTSQVSEQQHQRQEAGNTRESLTEALALY